ncbi:restriction endonuclease subunit S [Mycoplasmopsis citelli]|uniref:restriction endonuclease subunit S n=1 Tax=Mycoplasmopsis citelli TaxID=171281 RepID=UPI0021139670|nr:restriction endonuclease subunit S [Mycoplasmopsis citelli]UUD36347.1 restriction endonuclease subunit S [Mycoplasmopsis citelli]
MFFISIIRNAIYEKYSWNNKSHWSKVKKEKILLPTIEGKIDYKFIDNFIKELEAQRIAKLEAYLTATGLKDFNLTKEEDLAIRRLLNDKSLSLNWEKYKIKDLFEGFNGNFDIQKKHINNKGIFVVSSGLTNNGIIGKTDVNAKVFNKNTITIDMFGNAFYRNFDYKMVTHARVFSMKTLFYMSIKTGLFLSSSLKFLKEKFNYDYMCTWEKASNEEIILPTKNEKIDFEFMETLISAVQKLVIKDVVRWADQKIELTKQIVQQ